MNSRELKALTSQLRGRRKGERRNLPSLVIEYLSPPFTCFFASLGFFVMPGGGGGGGRVLQKFYTGRNHLRSNLLFSYISLFFDRDQGEKVPLLYTFYWHGTPFTYLV